MPEIKIIVVDASADWSLGKEVGAEDAVSTREITVKLPPGGRPLLQRIQQLYLDYVKSSPRGDTPGALFLSAEMRIALDDDRWDQQHLVLPTESPRHDPHPSYWGMRVFVVYPCRPEYVAVGTVVQ